MNNNDYIYQELINNTYIPITKGTTIELKPLDNKFKVRGRNYFPFCSVLISPKIISLLQKLLSEYKLSDSIDDFISLLVYCQHHFVSSIKKELKEISNDFIHQDKDLEDLMIVLKDYLFATDRHYINSISFKFMGNRKAVTIDNFFIVDDIYRAVISDFGLTKENFEERSQELISQLTIKNENAYSIKKSAEWFKTKVINKIYSYLIDNDFNQSQGLRFTGAFLTLCQIKSNNNDEELYIHDSLTDIINDVDIKNLLHYITRPKF